MGRTPDALIDGAQSAAGSGPSLPHALLIMAVADEATPGKAVSALETIANAKRDDHADDIRWLARMLAPAQAAPWSGRTVDAAAGPLVTAFAILGPFEDNGGGLRHKDGPDRATHRWVSADYSWGVYAVRTRRSVTSTVTARGLPLDLYVSPRRESCTYLASAVTLPIDDPVLHVAASGAFRLSLNGAHVVTREAVHRDALVDRAVVPLTGARGEQLVTLKVCTNAQGDAGRVRVRFTDRNGQDLSVATSSDPTALDRLAKTKRKVRFEPPQAPLAATSNLSGEAALRHAIVLQLAGADDQRAARAPGLFDTVARDGKSTADMLAVVGWLSPSVANRTGWLSSAAARAADADVRSFALRALVSSRLHTGAVDQAASTLTALAGEMDVHARWLRARVQRRLGGRGLRLRARQELDAIATARGNKTPAAVLRSLAQTSTVPGQRLAARQRLARAAPGERGIAFVRAHRHLGAGTLERAALRAAEEARRSVTIRQLGEELYRAGRYIWAERLLAWATELAPNDATAHAALARTRRTMNPTAPAAASTVAALERASELSPSDAELAAELAFRRGEGEGPQLGPDAPYLVAPRVFLTRAKKTPANKAAVHSRQLHWRRIVRRHADNRVSQTMHYAREIVVVPKTEGERYEELPGGYGSELLVARVHRKNGDVVAPEEEDASGPMVRWPPLERGDVVEIAIRNWTPGPVGRRGDAPFYFVDYVGSVDSRPVLYNDVVIDTPADKPLAFDVVGGKADAHHKRTDGGRRIDHLVWNNPPSVPHEPFAPTIGELVPAVVGSIYPGWSSFLTWYRGAVEGFTEPDDQVKRIAKEVTAGKTSRDAKVEALFNYVADDIRYVNYQSGEWWLPNRPQQLLARRQGDCDDKAMLLISLLRAVGIDATEVLVQTRHTAQRRLMQTSKVAIPMFDHGIIFLPNPNGKGGRFLDATSPKSRMSALPAMDNGALALRIADDAVLATIPAASPADHGVSSRATIKLERSGAASFSVTEEHTGDMAFQLRTHLAEPDTRSQWVEQHLVPGFLTGVSLDTTVSFDDASRVTFSGHAHRAARREGRALVLSVSPSRPLTTALAPLTKRTLAVELPPSIAPTRRLATIEIVAPVGFRFAPLPPTGNADGGRFGKATVAMKLSADGRRVTVTRNVTLAAWRISVNDYPAWRRWLQSVDALLRRRVRLRPHTR